nr:site-specific integrase [uncultured Pseudodesulfovibrio sp.]
MQSEHEKSFGTFSPKKKLTFFQNDVSYPKSSQENHQRDTSTASKRTSTHVYLKKNIYYFRYAFPLADKERLGYSEIRLSLRTAYKREALEYAKILYAELKGALMGSSTLTYSEIKIRLLNKLKELHPRLESRNEYAHALETASQNILGYPAPTPPFCPPSEQSKAAQQHFQKIELAFTLDELFDTEGMQSKPFIQCYKEFFGQLQNLAIACVDNDFGKQEVLLKEIEDEIQELLTRKATHLPLPVKNIVTTAAPLETPEATSLSYSELVDKYLEAKQSDGNISAKSVVDYKDKLSHFLDIKGDMQTKNISRDDIKKVKETLKKLPPQRNRLKKFRDKTIAELLETSHERTLSANSINQILSQLSSLFKWAIDEDYYVGKNPASIPRLKEKKHKREKCDPLTRGDIKATFSADKYIKDKHAQAAYFWAPLISLYTGMRREEISQLHNKDLYEHIDDDRNTQWVIDAKEESEMGISEDKRLKNLNATRIIPIHPDLIKIGLLEYHSRMLNKHTRLFPELNRSKEGIYGKEVGKQFSALLRKIKIKTPKKYFHSLRHSFRDQFKKKDISESCFYEVFGHESNEPVVTRRYGSSFTPKEKYDKIIRHLEYQLDIEMLSKSKFAKGKK